ncbi:hypothetical protein BDF14DRAFT_1862064 [Spinellus fusiger]|nr:hypothetical protein BDF14DRAFT_1862064 [Spinellus fusiger]
MNPPQHADRLLLIFVHGFRGSETSFKGFPDTIRASLTNTHAVDVDAIVYPSYKTMGHFTLAVCTFTQWLIGEIAQRQQEAEKRGDKSKLMAILLGHSMGGIVCTESIFEIHQRTDDPLRGGCIIGFIAYDTPFYSVNVHYMTSKVTGYADQVSRLWQGQTPQDTARQVSYLPKPTMVRSSWGLFAGVVGAAVVGTAAYMHRDTLSSGLQQLYDQLEFVSILANKDVLEKR